MVGQSAALLTALVVVCGACVAAGALSSEFDAALTSSLAPLNSFPTGEEVIANSTTLTSNLYASNLTIEPGVVLQSNGFSIVVSGTFNNQGTIVTGAAQEGSLPDSLGGSGGGAQSLNYCSFDQNGTSTRAPGGAFSCSNSADGGSGAAAAPPAISSEDIASWFDSGMQNYLAGGSGGAVEGYIPGGAGSNGLYIQAQTIVAGTIDATGDAGQGTCSGIGLSGGGGGGAVLLAYSEGLQSVASITVLGGTSAPSCNGVVASGAGGGGQIASLNYGLAPPVNASSSSVGNVEISSSQTLSSDLVAGNLTIEPGATVTTNGFSILVSGTFDNLGTVLTGSSPSGTLPFSLGGSGGGAQSLNYCSDDENGSSTLAPGGALSCSNSENGGAGSSPVAPPSLNGSEIRTWYDAGIQSFLAGSDGGAIAGYIPGGSGANGLYVQAQTIIPGSIVAAGAAGEGSCSGIGLSGAGGGGAVVLAFGLGVYGDLDFNAAGGAAAPSCNGVVASGGGGNGQLILVPYGTSPPVVVASEAPVGSPDSPAGGIGVHAQPGLGTDAELVTLGAAIALSALLLVRRSAKRR